MIRYLFIFSFLNFFSCKSQNIEIKYEGFHVEDSNYINNYTLLFEIINNSNDTLYFSRNQVKIVAKNSTTILNDKPLDSINNHPFIIPKKYEIDPLNVRTIKQNFIKNKIKKLNLKKIDSTILSQNFKNDLFVVLPQSSVKYTQNFNNDKINKETNVNLMIDQKISFQEFYNVKGEKIVIK